jgi:hypothetical protein
MVHVGFWNRNYRPLRCTLLRGHKVVQRETTTGVFSSPVGGGVSRHAML